VAGFEWKSKASIFRIPLIHVAFGRDARGKLRVAKGVIAVGQFAVGLITVAQVGLGVFFAFGQFVCGLAVAGQIAAGFVAIGQVVAGMYGLCQVGWAKYIWSPDRVDLEAVALFYTLKLRIFQFLGLE